MRVGPETLQLLVDLDDHGMELLCTRLEPATWGETQLISAFEDIFASELELGYANMVVLLRHTLGPHLAQLLKPPTRALNGLLARLCHSAPQALLDGVLVPLIQAPDLSVGQRDCLKTVLAPSRIPEVYVVRWLEWVPRSPWAMVWPCSRALAHPVVFCSTGAFLSTTPTLIWRGHRGVII